jgi:hypothetical protein
MGAEQIFPIGTILRRRTPQDDAWDEVRVTGTGVDLVVTSNKEFTPTRILDVVEARQDYNADFGDNNETAEENQVILVRPGLTPEQVFAKEAQAREAAGIKPEGRQGRKRSDPPAPVREGGE